MPQKRVTRRFWFASSLFAGLFAAQVMFRAVPDGKTMSCRPPVRIVSSQDAW
jgi:hypothetical protein